MTLENLTNNTHITVDDYMYTCDECGKQEKVSMGCFGICPPPENDWISHRAKDFCCQRCADTFEVKRPSMTRRITKREYEEKYGEYKFDVSKDMTRKEFLKDIHPS